jgi:uncharacterized membrane-anchored protein YhcB (DUF1043 family)
MQVPSGRWQVATAATLVAVAVGGVYLRYRRRQRTHAAVQAEQQALHSVLNPDEYKVRGLDRATP